jgi:cell wall-associated NlpC family hydrolase
MTEAIVPDAARACQATDATKAHSDMGLAGIPEIRSAAGAELRPIAPADRREGAASAASHLLSGSPRADTAHVPLRVWLAASSLIVLAGCASSGGVPQPHPGRTSVPSHAEEAHARPEPLRIVETALALQGAPYRNGGTDPSGFDCSGFVEYVFAQNGVALPRDVQQQWSVGDPIPRSDLRPGDLVFFSINGLGASHVGIAVGSDSFVHAPSSRGRVRTEQLSAEYWSRRFAGARRIVGP